MSEAPLFVVDSSVAAKWFIAEGEHAVEQALALLRQHQAGEARLAAPDLLGVEVLNALLSRDLAEDLLIAVAADLDAFGLDLAPLDAGLVRDALHIACAERLALYDAVFVALARRLDADLVTADGRQARTRGCRVRLI